MGDCKYCGESAGLLRTQHKECAQLAERGRERIKASAVSAIRESDRLDSLQSRIESIERECRVPSDERQALLIGSWETAVTEFLDDGVLDRTEEESLCRFRERFGLIQEDLDANGTYVRVAKAAVLRDVLSGAIPKRVTLEGGPAINLQKNEQVVWAFPNSDYLEDRVRRQYVGGSQGVSVRVMKGVYYRVGAFKGEAVETTERVKVDTGLVLVTDKNLYFAGSAKSVRVPYAKIVSFEPFGNGIGIMRDAASAKPQIFVTGDGWFTYNLVVNLAKL